MVEGEEIMKDATPLLFLLIGGVVIWYLYSQQIIGPIAAVNPVTGQRIGAIPVTGGGIGPGTPNCPGDPGCPGTGDASFTQGGSDGVSGLGFSL